MLEYRAPYKHIQRLFDIGVSHTQGIHTVRYNDVKSHLSIASLHMRVFRSFRIRVVLLAYRSLMLFIRFVSSFTYLVPRRVYGKS